MLRVPDAVAQQSPLPPELLLGILDSGGLEMQSLQAFRLSCKLFGDLGKSAMFRSFVLVNRRHAADSESDMESDMDSDTNLCDTDRVYFWISPAIAPLVTKCFINNNVSDRPHHEAIVVFILRRLELFVNLRFCSFSMLKTPIDTTIISQLGKLRYMRDISIFDCNVVAMKEPMLRIASISLDRRLRTLPDALITDSPGWGSVLESHHLRSIRLHLDVAQDGEHIHNDDLRSIFNLTPVPNLYNFSITTQPYLSTLHLLAATPSFTSQLRELKLSKISSPALLDTDITSPVYLPFMHTYSGPCNPLCVFRPGDALRTVQLGKSQASSICATLEDLSRSSKRLEDLSIVFDQITVQLLNLICTKFPHLIMLFLEHSLETTDTDGSYTPDVRSLPLIK